MALLYQYTAVGLWLRLVLVFVLKYDVMVIPPDVFILVTTLQLSIVYSPLAAVFSKTSNRSRYVPEYSTERG